MRPAFHYLGSKGRMVPLFNRLLPDKVDFYMEPFFGSGAVLLSRYPAKCEVVNDIDGRIVNFFRVLRERPDELVAALRLTPWAHDEFVACKEPTDDPLEAARRLFVLLWQSRNSNGDGSWRSGVNANRPASGQVVSWRSSQEAIYELAARFHYVSIENMDAVDFINKWGSKAFSGTPLIYADPPYPKATRGGAFYNSEDASNDDNLDHEALLESLVGCDSMCAVSTYTNELYSDVLGGAGWNKYEYQCHAFVADGAPPRTEVVWRNFILQPRLF